MICEILGKKGQPGTGAGRDAFAPGVRYVCSKATKIKLRNLVGDWGTAAEQMEIISDLSAKVKRPYYHIVLSWPEGERPTPEQQIAAMEHVIKRLGLSDHQAVIGCHDDTDNLHVHAVICTVHPQTGLAFSKSQDMAKVELACRELEVANGWSNDRGRFDFELIEDENGHRVELRPKPSEHFEEKKKRREDGLRPLNSGQIAQERRTGFPALDEVLTPAMKAAVGRALDGSYDWPTFHAALGEIGLCYEKFGSGARIKIAGSSEFAKASAFGSKFSIAKMERALGEYEPPQAEYVNNLKPRHVATVSVSAVLSDEDRKASSASTFKETLLRRIYVGITLDPAVAKAIRFVDLKDLPPQVTFRDGSTLVDHGEKLTASANSENTRSAMISMAIAKNWSGLVPSGPPEFVRAMAIEAAQAGLKVSGVPADVQAIADRIYADKTAVKTIEVAENAARKQHQIKQQEIDVEKAKPSKNDKPRLAPPDLLKADKTKIIQKSRQVLDNNRDELDLLKRLDIGIIAADGGWSDVSASHKDSSDPRGLRYRIYQRGDETIKASLVNGRWLWTNNKNPKGGSVIELWQLNNPGKNLGHARAALRRIAGQEPVYVPAVSAPLPKAVDHTHARQKWSTAAPAHSRVTYAEQRGISRNTLQRYKAELRVGPYSGILIAHRDSAGEICGYEQRWDPNIQRESRFAKGGNKTLAVFGDPSKATRICVTEAGLDALALAEIEGREDTLYVSTGGGYGQRTIEAIKRIAHGKNVYGAFDADSAGDAMHEKLLEIAPQAKRLRPQANGCKDWLDVLAIREKREQARQPDPNDETPRLA